ncbi:hypothetical protein QR680_016806 [Steinernema hermaphroditum]|uniref:Lipase domain-containing protein n=1 Tax=Steinernema hermaphroditum TaxID=289476 RepID=A0AA39HDB4_9BILA|nr:hypothetical protein QR680_016806 [Steinernema hermaphroditum]
MFYSTVLILTGLSFGHSLKGPFSENFVKFLALNDQFSDLTSLEYGINGSFGGKLLDNQQVKREPVIFIHGNSDGALDNGKGPFSGGWNQPIEYFMEKGYTSAELYALTWGDRNLANAGLRQHTCKHLKRIRGFIEAVLQYTESPKVDLVAHSMGVTLTRQAVKGGRIFLGGGDECDLGESLGDRVDTLLGIAGANYGLCSCTNEIAQVVPACAYKLGFWAGDTCLSSPTTVPTDPLTCQSATEADDCGQRDYAYFLKRLNEDDAAEGDVIMSMWSEDDEIVGNGGRVWGVPTGLIPKSRASLVFEDLSHEAMKARTGRAQFLAVTKHSFA